MLFSVEHAECSLLCVLEQPRVDNSSTGPLSVGSNWEQPALTRLVPFMRTCRNTWL